MWISRITAVALAVAVCEATAQDAPPPFRVGTDLVVLHVSVADRRGEHVPDLPQTAFAVFEDSRPQKIAVFRQEDEPVTAGLLIDSSISMQPIRDLVLAGSVAFTRLSHPEDEFFAIAFNDTVAAALPRDAPFTSDPDVLDRAMQQLITARGSTALFDAVLEGLRYSAHGTHERKALVVISDGGDNASHATFDDVLARARSSNVVIYAVAVVDELDPTARPQRLRQLAAETGGQAFEPRNPRDVGAALERTARELRRSYTIGYVPERPPDGQYRRLRVIVTVPGSDDRLVVRTRAGYAAMGGGTLRDTP